MQDRPLLVSGFIDYAERYHGQTEIVTRTVEGPIHRYGYGDCARRSRRAARAFLRLGVGLGDRIGTLAWNTHRHMEVWYGTAGIGAVIHTINPRLFADQIVYIVNHAEDRLLLVDLTFVALLESLAERIPGVEHFIILTDDAHMPETSLKGARSYESLLAAEPDDFEWQSFDENTACGLCYTSGTTGNPKGVLYSHRSNVLHTLMQMSVDSLGLSCRQTIMPVVPMFHANGWGVPFAAPATGARLVMPGRGMDGRSIYQLLEAEKVTITAAVPTVWLMLQNYLEESGKTLNYLESVCIGGSAAPRSMIEIFQDKYGVRVFHAWGMTELSPVGSVGSLKPAMLALSSEEQVDIQVKQGRALYGVELKVADDAGRDIPRDGVSQGHLKARGPWVAKAYFKGEGAPIVDDDDWFDTGDIVTMDTDGVIQITDRDKDVIKSGGEWISSIDLENVAVGHSGVAEAAVIGVAHPKWDERPLLIVVPANGCQPEAGDIIAYMTGKVAKWWLPDAVAFVDEIPHTATGKILKSTLREQFRDYRLPEEKVAPGA